MSYLQLVPTADEALAFELPLDTIVDIQVMDLIGPKMSPDEPKLREWTFTIAREVVQGLWTREDLFEEGLNIRVSTGDRVFVDTLYDRS